MPKHCEAILYPEDGFNVEEIEKILKSKKSIYQYAFILHNRSLNDDGSLKKDHYHVYMNFGKTNVKFENVANWFGVSVQNIQKIISDKGSTLKYYLHEGTTKEKYDISELVSNFDVDKAISKKEENLDDVIDLCASGVITRYNFSDHISPAFYSKYEPKIKRAWDYYDASCDTDTERQLEVYWLYGSTATGKSTLARMIADKYKMSIYTTSTGKDPFSYYRGEEIVVIDDLRPTTFIYDALLKILDPHYRSAVASRYHDKLLKAKIIIITTPYAPEDFVDDYQLSNVDSSEQLYRRLSEAR